MFAIPAAFTSRGCGVARARAEGVKSWATVGRGGVMARAPLVCVGVLALAACSAPGTRRPALSEAELLSGEPFAAVDAKPPITAADAVALDDSMRAFIEAQTGAVRRPQAKLEALLDGMRVGGLFALNYDAGSTRTARATFHEGEGNCLSFTMLFVALARGAGLDARYQIVDMPPDWSSESEFVVIRQHINALVRSSSMLDYVVDFNQERAEDRYRKRIVDDDHALALFYNNLGTEALIRRDFEPAFLYLRESVRVSPSMTMPWINLGALYSRAGFPDRAEAAYLHALALDPSERSALNNLATLHAAQGEQELAEAYQRRVRRYQLTNPYYRYALAQRAYAEERFDEAVGQTRKALRLKREEPNFYVLLGSAYLKMGRGSNAASIFERGRDYLEGDEALARYDAEIRALTDGAAAGR